MLKTIPHLSSDDCFNKYLATEVIEVRKNHVYGLSADPNESQHAIYGNPEYGPTFGYN